MDLEVWDKLRLVFKSGQVLELLDDGNQGLKGLEINLASSKPITATGLKCLPVIVPTEVTFIPTELAAVEWTKDKKITFNAPWPAGESLYETSNDPSVGSVGGRMSNRRPAPTGRSGANDPANPGHPSQAD